MKKNYLFLLGKTGSWLFAIALFLFSSCAQGYDDDFTFETDVKNAQLESPDPNKITITTVVASNGEESLKVEWPVVSGAGGYQFSLYNVDDPDNPVAIGKENELVDGCSAQRTKAEDTKYKVVIKTLGNAKYNNKEALAATEYAYSTLINAVRVPEDQDIAEFINSVLEDSETEQAFELEGGKTYTLNSLIDFRLNTITFRGDKTNRPTVVIGEKGGFITQAGLKIKFVNFDCTEMTATGLLSMSTTPDESLKLYDTNRYIVFDPIIFQECNIKAINKSLFYGNAKPYVIKDLRISDCIVQITNSSYDTPVINCVGNNYNCIKDFTVMNSTIYNLSNNSKAYFIRNANESNSRPSKLGFSDATGSINLSNNTFYKVMTGKDFANNMANEKITVTTTLQKNIFYDCYRVNKIIGSNVTKVYSDNFMFTVTNALDSTDKKYGTEEDPKFIGPVSDNPDKVNFKATGTLAVSAKAGDPRWLE